VKPSHKQSALNRLKTVRGHLDAVISMVEEERYCPQVMKQLSALQGSLERVNRVLLQNHLETCVPRAIAEERGDEIVEELMETLRYTSAVTGAALTADVDPAPDAAVTADVDPAP
jgi:DNA-binding FrmR family transcriptional regulator